MQSTESLQNHFLPSLQTLLRTLTYHSTIEEPSPNPRSLVITTTSATDTQGCAVTITISLQNDHHPEIDLNGPNVPTINYSTSLDYSIFTLNRAAVAADDASISDGDGGAVVWSVELVLVSGRVQNRLVLSETPCPDNNETVCHLRYKSV